MKLRYLALLLGCSLMVGVCIADTSRLTNVIDTQTLIEDTLQLKSWDSTNLLPYSMIYTNLDKRCSASSITEGKQLASLLQSTWTNDLRPRHLQSEMRTRFTLLKTMVTSVRTTDEQQFCKQKYLLYALMEYSQRLALGEKVGVEAQAVRWAHEHGSAEAQPQNSGIPQATYLALVSYAQEISSQTDRALDQLAQEIIQKEIGTLLSLWFLGEEDLQRLQAKVELYYVQRCGTTRGSYHMTQRTDGTERTLKQIKLSINLCSDRDYIALFPHYVRQIFIHELAHYLYYFKDRYADKFSKICRGGTEQVCQVEDFVSAYAQTSKEEDYAESFTYWYLKNHVGQSLIVDQEHGSAGPSPRGETKQRYFDRIYG